MAIKTFAGLYEAPNTLSDTQINMARNRAQLQGDSFANILKSLTSTKKQHPTEFDIREGIAEVGIIPKQVEGAPPIAKTNRFYLQNIQINKIEKANAVETFGESTLYTFDEKARIYSFSGIVLDSQDGASFDELKNKYRWASQLQYFYETYLKGYELQRLSRLGYLKLYGEVIFYGYPLQMVFQKNASMEHVQQFQTTWLVTKEVYHEFEDTDKKYIFKQDEVPYESDDVQQGLRAMTLFNELDAKLTTLTQQLDARTAEIDKETREMPLDNVPVTLIDAIKELKRRQTVLIDSIADTKKMLLSLSKKINDLSFRVTLTESSKYKEWD